MRTLIVCFLATAAVAMAQSHPPSNPMVAFNKTIYAGVKGIVLRAAEKMPEEQYAFKPTGDVRTFGQILGHIADSQSMFCALALGEKPAAPQIEKNKTTKGDLVGALKDVFAYCDRAYDTMSDAKATETVPLFGGEPMARAGVLTVNCLHTVEHYGNLVVYLRMKGIVPPTSEPGTVPQIKK